MGESLYQKYRPQKLAAVVGQPAAVTALANFLRDKNLPQAIMLSGPSGSGKTTIARILAKRLGVDPDGVYLNHVDCATVDPLPKVREIKDTFRIAPMHPNVKGRVWLLEEFQSLSRAGTAQQGLLHTLEFPGRWAYFFICTTDPEKIHKAVHTRCTQIRLGAVPQSDLIALVKSVAEREGKKLHDAAAEKVADAAAGSARQALVMLEPVLAVASEAEQLASVDGLTTNSPDAIQLPRLLLNPRTKWAEVGAVLRSLSKAGEDAEKLRRLILSYANAVLMSRESARAYAMIDAFRDDFFSAGFPALTASCFRVAKSR
jgi:DNA polymerase-3 subunit gamma/tau